MGVLFGNVVNDTKNQEIYYNFTNFPYNKVYVYDFDARKRTQLEFSKRVEKPVNGLIYVTFNDDVFDIGVINENGAYIVAVIINNDVLYYNNSDNLRWTNTRNAVINLNIVIETEIRDNLTVTMISDNDYEINNNNEYGIMASSGARVQLEKTEQGIKFNETIYYVEADGEDLTPNMVNTINDYANKNFILMSNNPTRMFISVIYGGRIFLLQNTSSSFKDIASMNTGEVSNFNNYITGIIYRAVEISSIGRVSITNT